MNRRNFIKTTLAGGSMVSLSALLNCSTSSSIKPVPKRALGTTGASLSVIGFGGILVMNEEQTSANNAVAQAFACGVNYYDVAPSYGNAQEKLGPALKPWRNRSFLACKTGERSKDGAEKELHESLAMMQTDHFDLYQLHALTTIQDVETAFGPNGAMEVFVKARQEGKVRFLGFSAHSEQAALLAMEKFAFDTILFPINFAAWLKGNFGPTVIAKAQEKGMGILALKGLAHSSIAENASKPFKKCWYNPIPVEDKKLAELALRFTLSQGVTAAIPPGEQVFFPLALELAANAAPVTEAEIELLRHTAAGLQPLFKNI